MSSRRTALLVAATLLVTAAPSLAQELLAQAPTFDCSELYASGEYEAAAECFEALERQGNGNGHLLYNLGNARYRAGQLGLAVHAWRRAHLFLPRDGDLAANLRTAREQLRDELAPPDQREPLARALLAPYDSLSARELLLLGASAWGLLFILLAIRLVRFVPGWLPGALALGAITLFGLGSWSVRSYSVARHPVAVVIVDEVTLRSGRDVMSTDLARLHEGAEASVVERTDDWVQVSLSTGLRGWMPAAAVGLVGFDPEPQ